MLPRSQPDMFWMQGYCWCSESYQRRSQKWRSGLEGEAKGESKWDLDHAVSSIDAWKAHYFILRTFQQDQARQDTLDWLDDQTIMVINDWAMKVFPMCFRKRQSQWFAKCGICWHLSAVVHKSTHPDCPVVSTSEHLIHICDYHWQLQTGLVFRFFVYLKMSLSVSKSRINQYVERSWEVIMLDATTVMHFCQPSIPLAKGKASK